MFESDQHEFDEGIDEFGYISPPPPVAKPAPEPVVSPASQAAETGNAGAASGSSAGQSATLTSQQTSAAVAEHESEAEDEEDDGYYDEEPEELPEFVDAAEKREEEPPPPPPKKNMNVLLIAGFAALVVFAVFVVYTATRPKDNAPPPGDMGPGIVATSGLRGHLTTRWDGNTKTGRLQYQLHIEPMEDRWQAGFSKAVLTAPLPIYANVRLLDATGFALCGKEIDFKFDPRNAALPGAMPSSVGANGKRLTAAERNAAIQAARQSAVAQMQGTEALREHGKDIFQPEMGPDGQAIAVNVQGTLPCSPDQYKRASYWDFNTNFPTLDEQEALVDPRAAAAALRAKQIANEPGGQAGRRRTSRPQEGFVIQGDDRVTEYDSAHGLLWAQGRTFQIDRRTGHATALAWANNNTLIHYRCDQQANCALTAAGGAAVLHARLSN